MSTPENHQQKLIKGRKTAQRHYHSPPLGTASSSDMQFALCSTELFRDGLGTSVPILTQAGDSSHPPYQPRTTTHPQTHTHNEKTPIQQRPSAAFTTDRRIREVLIPTIRPSQARRVSGQPQEPLIPTNCWIDRTQRRSFTKQDQRSFPERTT